MTLSVQLTVSDYERSGAQGAEGGDSPKGQMEGQENHLFYLPFVLAMNKAMVTVAPAACMAAMKTVAD